MSETTQIPDLQASLTSLRTEVDDLLAFYKEELEKRNDVIAQQHKLLVTFNASDPNKRQRTKEEMTFIDVMARSYQAEMDAVMLPNGWWRVDGAAGFYVQAVNPTGPVASERDIAYYCIVYLENNPLNHTGIIMPDSIYPTIFSNDEDTWLGMLLERVRVSLRQKKEKEQRALALDHETTREPGGL